MNPVRIEQPTRDLIRQLIRESRDYPAMGDFELQFDSDGVFAVTMTQYEKIVAGVIGIIACDWAYVETVWVNDGLRGQGIGKRLMLATESYVHQLDLNGIQLYTTGFQAPDFYPGLGYVTMGELSNRPQGYNATYFYKTELSSEHLTNDFEVENPVTEATFAYLEEQLIIHAEETEPIVAHERVFVLYYHENKINGGIFGHEFWGWLDVHLCYATTVYGVNQLLEKLESYCDAKKLGIVLPAYDDLQSELLKMRGYQVFGALPNRPSGKTCTVWIRQQPKT